MNNSHGFPAAGTQARREALHHDAKAALSSRRPEQAEKIARDILSKSSGDAEALYLLGVALLQQNRPQDAIAPLQQAAATRPEATFEANLGIALRLAGRKTEALNWLERATSHKPPLAPAFLEYGYLLSSLHRHDEAEAAFQRGADAAPRSPDFPVALGNLFMQRSQRERAKSSFQHALTLAPGHPKALHGLGTAMLDGGDFEAATQYFRKLVATGQADIQTGHNLGFCLIELGRWEEAIETFRSLIATDPSAFPKALRMLVTSGRGRFWLKPSDAARMLRR